MRRWWLWLALWLAAPAFGHDVSSQLRASAFLRADGTQAVLVLRLPLELMLNVDLPKDGRGYLDLAHVDDAWPRVLAAVPKGVVLLADGAPLAPTGGSGRVALPDDRAFADHATALAAVRGVRLPPETAVYHSQGWYDVALQYVLPRPDATLGLDFRVSPGLQDRLRLDLRLVRADGSVRAYELPTGGGPVTLDPRWHQAAGTFVASGVGHILGGADHLLFLLCLVVPFVAAGRPGWALVGVVTAFTLAHSVTLIAAALGVVPGGPWFAPLVEWLIAASILWMAVENVLAPDLRRRWRMAALFGLVHGFGFSFALAHELQFAGSHLLLSLVAFNVGIEIGQVVAVLVAWPLLAWAFVHVPGARRLGVAIVSLGVGHTAWHWLGERWDALAAVPAPEWPLDTLLRGGAALACLLLAGWLAARGWRRPAAGAGD